MQISERMFQPLILGTNHQFLKLSLDSISVVDQKPESNLIRDVIKTFAGNENKIVQTLSKRSSEEVKIFIQNIMYGLEKQSKIIKRNIILFKIANLAVMLFIVIAPMYLIPKNLFCTKSTPCLSRIFEFDLFYILVFSISWGLLAKSKTISRAFSLIKSKTLFCVSDLKSVLKAKKYDLSSESQAQVKAMIMSKLYFPIANKRANLHNKGFESVGEFENLVVSRSKELALTDYVLSSAFFAPMDDRAIFHKLLRKKWKMEKDYYFLACGQSMKWKVETDFFSEMSRQFQDSTNKAKKDIHFNFNLREEQDDNIHQFFQNRVRCTWRTVLGVDDLIDERLLPVSINPWDCTIASALFSYLTNWSPPSNKVEEALSDVTSGLSSEDIDKTKKQLENLTNFLQKNSKHGCLYAIYLPKQMVENPETNPFYHSNIDGMPIDRKKPMDNIGVLRRKFTQLGDTVITTSLHGRVFVNKIGSKNGVKIYCYNNIPKIVKERYYAIMHELVFQTILRMKPEFLSKRLSSQKKRDLYKEFTRRKAQELIEISKEYDALLTMHGVPLSNSTDDIKNGGDSSSQDICNLICKLENQARQIRQLKGSESSFLEIKDGV